MKTRIALAALVAAVAHACPAYATLTSTSNTVSYTGNDSTKVFTVPFKFLANTDLVVTVAGATKTLTTDYTVRGAGNATGTVTFITAPPSNTAVVITRVVPLTQTTSLKQNRTFDPTTIETALDRTEMQIQQNAASATALTTKDAAQDTSIAQVTSDVAALKIGSNVVTGTSYVLSRGTNVGANILKILDNNSINSQIISLNVESEFNPTGTSSWFNFGGTFEAFDPTSNAQNFTGQNYGLYGSYSHFGSGTLSNGFGVAGEAFNPGSNTATLVVGVSGHAHNGGVAAGSPVQTPVNTGSATNLRAISGASSNESSGTVTEATAFYANNCTNTGGGTITNCYGLHIANMIGGTSNRAILTDGGLVEHVGSVYGHAQLSLGLQTPDTAESLWIQPNASLTGTAQYGARIIPKTSSAATANGIGLQARADTVATTYTQALNIGLHSATPTLGAGSTVTEWDGVRVDAGPVAGTTYAIRTIGTNDLSMFAGPIVASNSKNKGTITLVAGSGTATVSSGAICVCSDTTAVNAVKCSVTTTTLTATGTGTDVIAYICL